MNNKNFKLFIKILRLKERKDSKNEENKYMYNKFSLLNCHVLS